MTRIAAVVSLLVAAAGLAYWASRVETAPEPGGVVIDLPRGTSSRRMAEMLAAHGVVRSPWHFLAARALRPRARLQAGEYRFDRPASASGVISRLIAGDVIHYELTVPEGSNIFDIAEAVEKLGLAPAAEFLAAARDPAPIRDLAPQAQSLEGYLFPSTYYVSRYTTVDQLCRRMTAEFRRVWAGEAASQPPDTPVAVHHAVTLASLVEKETGAGEERPLVASVFHNRLALGMKLDCDPTVIYAALIEGRYRGAIRQSDLDRRSPFNTYQRAGLPPGPIANPGAESLRAALQPARTKFLYFVAKPGGNGTHVFSATLAEHSRAVGQYRNGLRRESLKRQAEARRVARAGKARGR